MPELPSQAPTEAEKRAGNTEHTKSAQMHTASGVKDIEIITKTQPNASGGYDTQVHMPVGAIGIRPNKPGG